MVLPARRDPWRFRRQQPIDRYIVDFVCFAKRLIVEVDGEQHFESRDDRTRDARLGELGFEVLRFWNSDVQFHLEAVVGEIERALTRRPDTHPSRAPRRRTS